MNVYIRINSLAKKNHQNKRIMKEESDIIFNSSFASTQIM